MNKLKISIFFSMSLMILGSSVMAAPPDARDDGTGWCDGLDPTSSLYSTCIQAYSATNRLEHLQSKNASANAVSKAQASLDEALAQYEELGGGSVPGLEPVSSCPCNTQNVAGGSLWGSEEFVVGGGVNTGVAPYPPLNGNGGTAQYTVVWEGSTVRVEQLVSLDQTLAFSIPLHHMVFVTLRMHAAQLLRSVETFLT
jgi:hypothetical protein